MINTKDIFPIGIGTWGIGGLAEKNPNNNDEKQIDALVYMLNKGLNFVEVCYWYSEGKAAELFKKSVDKAGKSPNDLFLSISLYQHRNPTLSDVNKEFETLKKLLKTSCFDNVLVTFSGIKVWGQIKTIDYLHSLLDNNEARFVSITNSNLEMLQIFKREFGNKFFGHELTFGSEIRENFDNGIIDFSDKNNIRNVVRQPLRRNNTALRNWPLLIELSKKYQKTQNQIILRWLTLQGFLPLVKSENIKHIDENLDSLSFNLDGDDIKKLNQFRPKNWKSLKIDWDKTGHGISVSQLPTIFDKEYDKQQAEKFSGGE